MAVPGCIPDIAAMKKRRFNSFLWKWLIKYAALVVVVLAVSLALYGWYLSYKIEKRFSGRRWNVPSKVLSDLTILYPGQGINRTLFQEKLQRLGYRKVSRELEHKGDLRLSPSVIDIFLHDLDIPSHKREGLPARIRLSQDRIASIERFDTGEYVPLLELEPEEIGLFFGAEREQRQLVSIKDVPENLVHAVLAAEDKRFYQHHGMDPWGVLRALYTDIRHAKLLQGGSTITQQLAKSYFLTPKRTISRKLQELLMSFIIEAKYGKNVILEIYLNEIYLGRKGTVSVNGVGEASNFLFGKPVSELSLPECAAIAGMIKAPNHYSPYANEKLCKERRNAVLRMMKENGWISEAEVEAASSSPVTTVGFAAYGRKAPYFVDYFAEQLKALYPEDVLTSYGLTIYTTLDTQVQLAAERALEKGLEHLEEAYPALRRTEPENKLQGAVIVMQPKTGYILALAGGRNYGVSQFNRIAQARRQPGSAFKPFVFLSALDRFTPASILSNEPKTYVIDGKTWVPENYEPMEQQFISMRSALAQSVNLATIDLAMQVGLDRVVDTANAFHFSTTLKPYPSISLGAFEVVPLELARAYCAFAANGVLPYPLSLKEVLDEHGQVLERRHMTIEPVTTPEKAFMMSSLMRSVVTEGTAHSLRNLGISFPVAGKTGTTTDYKDAWFVGYTSDILALVWVGFDNGDSVHLTGSAAALPIWADIMNSIPQYVSDDWFKVPPGVVTKTICSDSGQLAVRGGCPNTVEEFFLAENAPTQYCPIHRGVNPFDRMIREGRRFFGNF